MEFTSLLNTSLDLNAKPLRFLDEEAPPLPAKQEVESNFIGLDATVTAVKEERIGLIEELKRVSAENMKLTELVTVMCENYSQLQKQLMEHTTKLPQVLENNNISKTRKRKAESSSMINNGNNNDIGLSECSSSYEEPSKKPREEHNINTKPKITRVCVRTEASDNTSLIVKDGYQWRKYGQKVTRDNPCPRAYFKCSFAPTCPVKKKVQRSIEDQSMVVATYEGEHNHPVPTTPASNRSSTSGNTAPTLTKPNQEESRPISLQHYFNLVEQMASTLTSDPNFKSALAAAISGKNYEL
ncbi:Probable WRKY transcription factor 40 [Striga hermonthica]|uniref:Probable WRKY transcription factor 40 n=1 Tax=Striga hermonthica TaxID=68872 RepID=A0A9N7R3T6_STRHE|nr:Probable WRKY transcription factor 40 [Striga hermonthica]